MIKAFDRQSLRSRNPLHVTVVRLSLFLLAGVYAELPLLLLASGIALISRYLST